MSCAWSSRFPELFAERHVAFAGSRVRATTEAVPDVLVAKLHLVAVTERGEVLVCRADDGDVFLPGGTREPGETLPELARRELREEAGAELTGDPQQFLSLRAESGRPAPFRPHLPHPLSYWCFAVAPVRVVGDPTNPDDGERVVEVRPAAPEHAAALLETNEVLHADVVRLAVAMGLVVGRDR